MLISDLKECNFDGKGKSSGSMKSGNNISWKKVQIQDIINNEKDCREIEKYIKLNSTQSDRCVCNRDKLE